MRWKQRKRLALRGAVATAIGLMVASAAAGCFTHQCDPSSSDYYGGRITADKGIAMFETTDISDNWLDYPGNATIRVHFPMDVGDQVSWPPMGYVGISRHPNSDQESNLVEAVGSLAEYSHLDRQGFTVTNATCAHYFAYFKVYLGAFAGGADAGAD